MGKSGVGFDICRDENNNIIIYNQTILAHDCYHIFISITNEEYKYSEDTLLELGVNDIHENIKLTCFHENWIDNMPSPYHYFDSLSIYDYPISEKDKYQKDSDKYINSLTFFTDEVNFCKIINKELSSIEKTALAFKFFDDYVMN